MPDITRERAARIARGHACTHCQEYSYRKLSVKLAPTSIKDELGAIWIAVRTCGICGRQSELGLDSEGEIVFEG